MKQKKIIGDQSRFAIEYSFCNDAHDTEIAMFINGSNILAYRCNGNQLTTRWNLDELALWLRDFLDEMKEDPYPVDCEGEYAAQKDDAARDFDSDDDAVFDEYYQKLYDWNLRHRWHAASGGAILADVYFQLKDDCVEISWNNKMPEDGVEFLNEIGGARVRRAEFVSIVDEFLKDYAEHWFS